jgi:hypothetical protein
MPTLLVTGTAAPETRAAPSSAEAGDVQALNGKEATRPMVCAAPAHQTTVALPLDPLDRHLGAFRRELADAASRSDDEVAELLTSGYALVLELEASYEEAGRHIDDALSTGDDEAVIAAARRQRGVRAAAGALREELEALAAIHRLRRGVGGPLAGP